MLPSAKEFAAVAIQLIQQTADRNAQAVEQAADLLYRRLQAGGVIQAFGTGHSVAGALEVAGRAGGLVPTNRISLTDLVLHGGEPPSALADPLLERSPGVAARLLDLAAPQAHDTFIIFSNSGVNTSVIDMAIHARDRGFPVVAVTSVTGTAAIPSRHPTGTRLIDHADIVLDNCAPDGDTLFDIGESRRVGAVSSISSAVLVQMVVTEVARRYVDDQRNAPVYCSANIPGGHESNLVLEARYAGRIRRGGF